MHSINKNSAQKEKKKHRNTAAYMNSASDLKKLRILYKLKEVYRWNSVGNRKESAAEHSWSSMALADFFMDRIEQRTKQKAEQKITQKSEKKIKQKGQNKQGIKLNRLRVHELLIYHDIVEIYAGDISTHLTEQRKNKEESERKALERLSKELPEPMNKKLIRHFKEFEEGKTIEARFAKAIDKIDALIHELDYKKDWIGWNEKIIRETKENAINEFPELKDIFEEAIEYARKNKYLEQ